MCQNGKLSPPFEIERRVRMYIKLLGIDLAKNVFQLHGVDGKGKMLMRKQLKRDQLLNFIANVPPCTIAMEACGSANYWGRQF
jgi:transposase